MRSREAVYARIVEAGILAVIRLEDSSKAKPIADALLAGGLANMEITFTTPGALDIIQGLASEHQGDFLVGAGTVIDPGQAKKAIAAGAEYLVSPVCNLDIIDVAHEHQKVAVIGAFTPTEILRAWEAGADLVKVFPATALGPQYFRDLKGPLPRIKFVPTGGVSLENAIEFIKAGAECIGVGGALLNETMIADEDWKGLTSLAREFVHAVKQARRS